MPCFVPCSPCLSNVTLMHSCHAKLLCSYSHCSCCMTQTAHTQCKSYELHKISKTSENCRAHNIFNSSKTYITVFLLPSCRTVIYRYLLEFTISRLGAHKVFKSLNRLLQCYSGVERQNAPALPPELWAKVFSHLEELPETIEPWDDPDQKQNQAEVHQLKLVCRQFRDILASHSGLMQHLYSACTLVVVSRSEVCPAC